MEEGRVNYNTKTISDNYYKCLQFTRLTLKVPGGN